MSWSTIILIIAGVGLLFVIPAIVAYYNGYGAIPGMTSQGREDNIEIKTGKDNPVTNPDTSGKLPGTNSSKILDFLSLISPPVFFGRLIANKISGK